MSNMQPSTAEGPTFRVGTRASRLARVQTGDALRRLGGLLPGVRFEERPCSSPGDRDRATDLRDSPGDFFTRDLDLAVAAGDLDMAIHSAKDLPDPVPEGLDWCWLPWREDPRDALVLAAGRGPDDLPPAPRFGISSARREAWCLRRFPSARLLPLRGNIEERLAKLDAGEYDALVMAGAALSRLGLAQRITQWIPVSELPPPEGQGVLALTFKAGNARLLRLRSLLVKAVAFVSAGTSAGSCTLDGLSALKRGEVCLYDSLLDAALLEALPPEAERVDVGKRCGRHSLEQGRISALIAERARKGRRVVRLKGGDAGLFGRLGEEIQALEELRLPYRVIPGVSSLNAATTGTGMLLTRRGVSRGFCAMTPRAAEGGVAPVDGAERARLPVVFFMAAGMVGDVADRLRADGTPGDTPAAVVFSAGTDEERVVRGTLADIGGRARLGIASAAPDAPGLVIVGEAAGHEFNRQAGALGGRRILLTASEALQEAATGLVHDLGGVPVGRPLIRLAPLPEARETVRGLAAYDWVILTSPSAVRCLGALLREAAVDVRTLPRLMTCGPGTDRELRRLGLSSDATAGEEFGAAGLLAVARRAIQPPARVLRLRSEKAGAALADGLRAQGLDVEDMVLYRNERIAYARLPEFDAVFFASASAVEAFADLWGVGSLANRTVAAIGNPTRAALRSRGADAHVTGAEATVESCLQALAGYFVGRALGEG